MTDERTTTGSAERTESLSLLVSGANGVCAVSLERDREYVLGRTEGAAILVPDPSVSRRHALLRTDDLTLEDLGSSNGTRVRGVVLRPGVRAQVDVGTVIELGNATLLLQRVPTGRDVDAPPSGLTSRPPPGSGSTAEGPVVRSAKMQNVYRMLDVIAPSDLSVVILGESGAGKEVFAHELHRRSLRCRAPFLRLNCASIAESLMEAELFGHEKGAFTGAVAAKAGLFEAADGGTIFLDEIGEMPLSMQAKILRVLENREVLRVGAREPKHVDVRFVAATHRDLRYLIASGRFRQDLYFRLNGFTVVVPSLRERREEIPALADRFIAQLSARSMRHPPVLSPDAKRLLMSYDWPGNVRELRTFIERALAFCRGGEIVAETLLEAAPELRACDATGTYRVDTTDRMAPIDTNVTGLADGLQTLRTVPAAPVAPVTPAPGDLRAHRAAFERERILAALAKTAGNQKRAAEELGVSRRTLVNKLEQYGIERPRKG